MSFHVALTNFSGPFDVLLELISKRKLDVTEIALHEVTDDFLAYIKENSKDEDCETLTYFVVVAATLLDMKTLRLLPGEHVLSAEDAAILEAKDLLFAKLLEYQAIKRAAEVMHEMQLQAPKSYPRLAALEAPFAQLKPPMHIGISVTDFAHLAAWLLTPRPQAQPALEHIHTAVVSVQKEASRIMSLYTAVNEVKKFPELIAATTSTLEVVATFLAVLELFRDTVVLLEQEQPFGELLVAWTGNDYDPATIGE